MSVVRPKETGFTLIEMLVALAIFSLAALALLRLGGATAANSARLQDQAMAQIVARNLAVEMLTDPAPPAFGTLNGEIGQWRPPLALDADDGPLARGADPADRDTGGQPVRRSRPGQPDDLPAGRHMNRPGGFTLVEMLIALSIFGMLTAAGVALLGVTARTQETSDRLLAELGEIRRTGALLNADLAQAAPRLYRDRDGRPQRAFTGGRGDEPG